MKRISASAKSGMSLVPTISTIAGLLLLASKPAFAQQVELDRDAAVRLEAALQARLDSLHGSASFPGATLGVALPGGRVIGIATGMADTSRHEPMTPEARLFTGSAGKTYVAAVAMQLVHEGRLGLDEPISNWLGEEPWFDRLPNARDITVRMLMRHQSGLVRYEFMPAVLRKLTEEPDHIWTPEERVSYLLDTEPPFAAGEGWDYSDTNYIVLGMIIERITGAALNGEIARRVLGPLQLENTIPTDRRELPGVVQGYAGTNNPFGGRDAMIENGRFAFNPQMEWAGGGYATTAADLAYWGRALYEGRAFDAGLLPQMLDAVTAPMLGPNTSYGLGVIITSTDLGATWGHSGFFPGYATEMRYYPEHGFAVALQFNTSVGRAIGRNPAILLHGFATVVAEALAAARVETEKPAVLHDRGPSIATAGSSQRARAISSFMISFDPP